MAAHLYVRTNEAPFYADPKVAGGHPSTIVNRLLMGSYLTLVEPAAVGGFYRVRSMGKTGWMREEDTTANMGLKIFFLDVGQGDGALVEVGKHRFLVDAGPDAHMKAYLVKWQYKHLLNAGATVHLDALFVSHFDEDHYNGFTELLADVRFTFGAVYHNGIGKCAKTKTGYRPPFNTGLGEKYTAADGTEYLKTNFDSLDDLVRLRDAGGLQAMFVRFITALETAHRDGRLQAVRRLRHDGAVLLEETVEAKPLRLTVLGPVCEANEGRWEHRWLQDDSHTVNGHSLVLKLEFGTCSVLLGGDLNTQAEEHLMAAFAPDNPFRVDVAKSCHHGSSEFSEAFMDRISPLATVISSGDNESYSHPRADAVGCAGKYSRSARPLVFSTELARSTNLAQNSVLYGLINLRCDGERIFMAQMKEARTTADLWDSYQVK
ncbi:ComEC/Rec2 family competence protein [Hymenobacter nivis]|uniref:MBL fold metallo-hydrolase n=1 Tax=Hymenobacter nivis TaxID=1850093 RepID=A0A502G7B4_9BACT|nr:hypothetical protein [Hymenobacter nivis]TPG58007.1 hypothetical protein EAH73_22705 [Hymenobacter nivis]